MSPSLEEQIAYVQTELDALEEKDAHHDCDYIFGCTICADIAAQRDQFSHVLSELETQLPDYSHADLKDWGL